MPQKRKTKSHARKSRLSDDCQGNGPPNDTLEVFKTNAEAQYGTTAACWINDLQTTVIRP